MGYITVSHVVISHSVLIFSMLGLDWGGLSREWFQLVCTELFETSGLFVKLSQDSQQSLVTHL